MEGEFFIGAEILEDGCEAFASFFNQVRKPPDIAKRLTYSDLWISTLRSAIGQCGRVMRAMTDDFSLA